MDIARCRGRHRTRERILRLEPGGCGGGNSHRCGLHRRSITGFGRRFGFDGRGFVRVPGTGSARRDVRQKRIASFFGRTRGWRGRARGAGKIRGWRWRRPSRRWRWPPRKGRAGRRRAGRRGRHSRRWRWRHLCRRRTRQREQQREPADSLAPMERHRVSLEQRGAIYRKCGPAAFAWTIPAVGPPRTSKVELGFGFPANFRLVSA